MKKIDSLKEKGASITDHIAIAEQEKAKKKSERMSNMGSTKATKPTKATDKTMKVHGPLSMEEGRDLSVLFEHR